MTKQNSALPTIDSVFDDMDSWRSDPKRKRAIPDDLWLKIFALTESYSEERLRKIFGLNSKQYSIKRSQLIKENSKTKQAAKTHTKNHTEPEPTETQNGFCEVKITPSLEDSVPSLPSEREIDNSKKQIKKLCSTSNKPENYLDLSTVVVECVHPNGQTLKIHTTNKSLTEVMKAFYALTGVAT